MENNSEYIVVEDGVSLDVHSLVQENGKEQKKIEVLMPDDIVPKKRGPGRPPKNKDISNMYTDIVTGDTLNSKKKKEKYKDELEKDYSTNVKMLLGVIGQAEQIHQQINLELDNYKERKTYGGSRRTESMATLMSTQANLLSTKISAIRELNSVRNKINDLDIKHTQLTKETNDNNSDKAVLDAYNVLLNAPNYGLKPINPLVSPMSLNTGYNMEGKPLDRYNLGINGIVTESNLQEQIEKESQSDPQYDEYIRNLNPVQKRMILEHNPDVKTVVRYNKITQNKRFDVVNIRTGESIRDVDLPGEFKLDGIRIDLVNGIAKNKDTNEIYPLIVEGSPINHNRVRDEI